MIQHLSPTNEFGAFCSGARIELSGSSAGPLRGLTFAAKDNFDVKGFVTGAGSPDWKETHAPARYTAQSIRQPARRWVEMNTMEHRGIQRRRLDFLVVPPVVQHVLEPAAKLTLHWGPTPHVQFDSPLHFAAFTG
jgi:hypothetical protein